jgi:hypothetical protein
MNKPKIKLSGENGNIFNLLGIAINALENAGQKEQAEELTGKVMNVKSYHEALNCIREYCIVS